MSTELDKELSRLTRIDRVHKLFVDKFGSSFEQAEAAAKGYHDKFSWNGVNLEFRGKLASDDDAGVREYFESKHLGFLFSDRVKGGKLPDVDRDLLAAAKAGNLTAKSKLFVSIGKDQKRLDLLLAGASGEADAQGTKDEPAPKLNGRSNPWSKASWNVSAQGKLIREIGLQAASSIAKSAGSFVGATKPAA
jgi:hypothetical protein